MRLVLVMPWSMAPTKSAMRVVLPGRTSGSDRGGHDEGTVVITESERPGSLRRQSGRSSGLTRDGLSFDDLGHGALVPTILVACSPGGLAAGDVCDLGDGSPHLAEFVRAGPPPFAEGRAVGRDKPAVSGPLHRRPDDLGPGG